MGLFKSIKKAVKKTTKAVAKTVVSPSKLTTAVLTGGLSVVKPSLTKPLQQAVKKTLFDPGTALFAASFTIPALRPLTASTTGGSPMAINLGRVLGVAGQALGGLQGQAPATNVLRTVGALSSIASAAVPVKTKATPAMAVVPAAARAGAVVARGFFNRFPNLATAIQKFRNAGMPVTRSKLHGLLRRFGPEFLVSAGILSAAAVAELSLAGSGRRRMNPANVKALRRSSRRLEAFHKLCQRVDTLRRPRGRSCKTRGGSQQFVRQG